MNIVMTLALPALAQNHVGINGAACAFPVQAAVASNCGVPASPPPPADVLDVPLGKRHSMM